MRNLLNDPDVMELYKALQNKRYENVEDFLTSSPTDQVYIKPKINKPKLKSYLGGEEIIEDYIESDDYGL